MSWDIDSMRGPVLAADGGSAQFFAGAAREELLIPRCERCSKWLPPEAETCSDCAGLDLVWCTASGRGTLVTWTVVHKAPHASFAGQVPFSTGLIELLEGPWMLARLVGMDDAQVGAPMTAVFVHPEQGEHYPVFMPDPLG